VPNEGDRLDWAGGVVVVEQVDGTVAASVLVTLEDAQAPGDGDG
jgi:hypothetical protein